MQHISYAHTTQQVRDQSKDVTRRLGWKHLKPGTLIQPIVKGQGLKKGERVEKIGGPVRVVSVRQEALSLLIDDPDYGRDEMRREGFPGMDAAEFIARYFPGVAIVTRIEFAYTVPATIEGEADRETVEHAALAVQLYLADTYNFAAVDTTVVLIEALADTIAYSLKPDGSIDRLVDNALRFLKERAKWRVANPPPMGLRQIIDEYRRSDGKVRVN